MKFKLSISVDENTIYGIQKVIRENKAFRNKSHFFEVAAEKLISEAENGK